VKLIFLPSGSVRLAVTVRVLPSAEITMVPVLVAFPPFFSVSAWV
jgi:hypothetical protein